MVGLFRQIACDRREAGDPEAISAPVFAALCLAENALGPGSYRPDDIITMHSGMLLSATHHC